MKAIGGADGIGRRWLLTGVRKRKGADQRQLASRLDELCRRASTAPILLAPFTDVAGNSKEPERKTGHSSRVQVWLLPVRVKAARAPLASRGAFAAPQPRLSARSSAG